MSYSHAHNSQMAAWKYFSGVSCCTGGNRPVCTAGKSQWSCSTKNGSKSFNGLTGSPMSSCLDADSDSRSPQVPIAVQPDIALDNLSAGDSLGCISSAWYFPLRRTSSQKASYQRALPSALEALPPVLCWPSRDSCFFSVLSFFAWCDFKNIFEARESIVVIKINGNTYLKGP